MTKMVYNDDILSLIKITTKPMVHEMLRLFTLKKKLFKGDQAVTLHHWNLSLACLQPLLSSGFQLQLVTLSVHRYIALSVVLILGPLCRKPSWWLSLNPSACNDVVHFCT